MQNQTNHQNGCLAKEDREELIKHLTPLQYRVTQHKITERFVRIVNIIHQYFFVNFCIKKTFISFIFKDHLLVNTSNLMTMEFIAVLFAGKKYFLLNQNMIQVVVGLHLIM